MRTSTRTGRLIALAAATMALGVLPPAPASAMDGTPTSVPCTVRLQAYPTLNGHAFMATTEIPDPFVRTTFRSTLGVGVASNYPHYSLVVAGRELTASGDLLYANLGFEYQQAIKSWLAMNVQMDIYGRLGTGLRAALTEGVRASTTGQVGWLVRVLETDRLYLSSSLSVSSNSTTRMDPLGFINGVIVNGGEVTDSTKLVTTTPTLLTTAGVRGAYELSKVVGLVGFAQASAGDSYKLQERSATYAAAGVGADVDFHKWLHAPLSLAVGYRVENYPATGDESKALNHTNVVQFGYLSAGGFAISMDLTNEWLRKRPSSGPLHLVWPLLTMKYYF